MARDPQRPRTIADLLPLLDDPAAELAVIDQCRELCRQAYAMGRADGWREGYERGARVLEAEWPGVVARVVRGGPSYAELEQRRWGPGGRERFGDPRPGDRFPGTEAAS
jgi:hypothetical protein